MSDSSTSSMKIPVLPDKNVSKVSLHNKARRREAYKFNVLHLWQAFCRKWWQAILLGIILASLLGPIIWLAVPLANPLVYARVQFLERANGNWQGHPDPPIHRQTQIALIKDPMFLAKVISTPEVAALRVIKEQPEPEYWLMKELRIEFPSGPELMQFSMTGDQPLELKIIINAVRNAYLQNFGDTTLQDRQERLIRLIDYENKVKSEIKFEYEKLKSNAQTGKHVNQDTINLNFKINAELLENTKSELIRTKSEIRQYKTNLKIALEEKGPIKTVPSKLIEDTITQHPALLPLLQEFAAIEDLLRKTKEAAPNNPKVASLQKELDETRKKIDAKKSELYGVVLADLKNKSLSDSEYNIEIIKHKIKQLEESEKMLSEAAEKLNMETAKLNTATVQVEEERQQIQLFESIRNKLAVTIEQLRAEQDAPRRIREYLDVVISSTEKYSNKIRMTIIGSIALFLASIFLVAFWESRSRRITSSEEVLDHFGMNVVGTVPAPPKRLALSKVDDDAWQNVLTESVDAFRTQLVFKARHHKHQVIMVSSADSGEGKTSLACHLALSLARSGQKTLLVDADLRNPTVNQLFDVPLEPGLSEVILGTQTASDAIQRSSSSGLWILPAGRCSRRVVELLAQDTLKNLFADLRLEFDFVIVDSSPILLVADPLLIAQQTDGVVFSIMHQVSKFTAIRDAVDKLSSLQVQTLGAVMNGTKPYQGYKNRKYAYRTMSEN